MSDSLTPALQCAYDLAASFYEKGTECPLCDRAIKSVAIKGNKVLFMPCGCVFAVASTTSSTRLFPEPRRVEA